MNDEQYLLANAYVDGELTDDERRIAEADPDVMSEVEEIRALQAELRAVEPPSTASRESAIAAAMGEFALRTVEAPRDAVVVPHRPRPAYGRFLAVAAAVVAVGLLGVVVVNSGLRGSDDDDAGADMATEAVAEATAEATAADADRIEAADAADEAGGAEMLDDASEMTAEESTEMSEEAAEEESGDTAVADADSEDDDTFEAAESEPAAGDGGVGPRVPIELGDAIETPEELGSYGALLRELEIRGELGSTPNTKCPARYTILGETQLVELDTTRSIYVGTQDNPQRVVALDTNDCTIVLVGPLYELAAP